jgi:hypothetical protein
MIWSDDAISKINSYASAGLTSAEIAEKFGCTRNAVMGKVSRLGLQLRNGNLGPRPGCVLSSEHKAKISLGLRKWREGARQ